MKENVFSLFQFLGVCFITATKFIFAEMGFVTFPQMKFSSFITIFSILYNIPLLLYFRVKQNGAKRE
jgi:hypothetical protein